MAYIKTIWVNEETPLNAQNMNHLEDGVFTLDTGKMDISNPSFTGTLNGYNIDVTNVISDTMQISNIAYIKDNLSVGDIVATDDGLKISVERSLVLPHSDDIYLEGEDITIGDHFRTLQPKIVVVEISDTSSGSVASDELAVLANYGNLIKKGNYIYHLSYRGEDYLNYASVTYSADSEVEIATIEIDRSSGHWVSTGVLVNN